MGHFDPEQIQPDLANVNAEAGTADVVFSLVEKRMIKSNFPEDGEPV